MANCKYQLNIEGNVFRFDSDEELTKFISSNQIDPKKAIKFSLELTPKQAGVITAVRDTFSENKYKNNKGQEPIEFLKTPQNTGRGPELLAPFFDTDNYIKNEVAKTLKEMLQKGEIMENEVDDFSKRLTEELEEDLLEDEFAKNLGKNIHSIVLSTLEKGINSPDVNTAIMAFIKYVEGYKNESYTLQDLAKYNKIIKDELLKFNNFVYSKGTPIVKPRLIHYEGGVKASPDLIVIDANGNPHIIDISLSRKPFGDWHSAKTLTQDYKLGIERQLTELICSTKNAGLYVAPFSFQDFSFDNFMLGKVEDRVLSNRELDPVSGTITKKLVKLLPGKYTELHQDDNIDELNDALIGALLPQSYQAKSKFILTNKDRLIKRIKEAKKPDQDYYILRDYISNETIKIAKEEDIEKTVDEYLIKYNANKHSELEKLKRTLLDAMKSKNKASLKFGRGSGEVIVNSTFERYINDGWELIDNDLFTNQGILVFKNNTYNLIEAVSVTANDLNTIHAMPLGNTLLGKFFTNEKAAKDREILPATTTNIELIRVLSILNNSPELFNNAKLGNVKVLNYYSDKKWDTENMDLIVKNFNKLYKVANAGTKLDSPNRFEKEIKLANPVEELYKEI